MNQNSYIVLIYICINKYMDNYTLNENRIIVLKKYVVQYFSNDKP